MLSMRTPTICNWIKRVIMLRIFSRHFFLRDLLPFSCVLLWTELTQSHRVTHAHLVAILHRIYRRTFHINFIFMRLLDAHTIGDNLIERNGFYRKENWEINLKHVRVWWENSGKIMSRDLHFTPSWGEIYLGRKFYVSFMWRKRDWIETRKG